MYVVSLIAPRGLLDPSLVTSLQTAWGGGEAVWLSPDEAAEFPVAAVPGNLDPVRADVAGMSVDVNVVPAEGRRKRLLIADMDSTMIGQECIDELADEAGVGAHVAGITARAMNGELDFEEALTERVGLLKGLPVSVIDRVLDTRITLAAGGPELVATMRAGGARAALVSGGFVQFTGRIAEKLGFDEHRANTLLEADGTLTGDVARPILGRDAKVTALNEITAAMGVTPMEAVAVGDGANDLGMIEAAGMGVALHAKPSVAAQAPVRVDHGDLTALLFLQGYARADFVTP
ncbi:phosphoserine phosphatase SerB [Alphaproteobacteria bacterium GH1-50]|uniref:Phosphoserine phosphatase n=1 Tax=Kangsaoukella pontilimi TaxID=2691042 RepID=A0A7C9IQL2_9RHOB|nr:phosphoserine phosphatase SerB [Kangsaoukella pontilimi]MXQ09370.1 phosphoserine phosphatase SerB [Kangsaoukella pontilimi]